MNAARDPVGDLALAIDQGSHATRATLIDAAGVPLATARVAVQTREPAVGWVEHDADALIESVTVAIQQAAAQVNVPMGTRIRAALATQRSTIVCWDNRTGEALSPAISWQDRRNVAWLATLAPRADEIRAMTGLRLSPHYGASKLRWCHAHLPAVAVAARSGRLACGPLASFIVNRVTRERSLVADPANASRTLLWSPATGDWSDDLLAMFGIDRAWLPRAVPTVYANGTLDFGRLPVSLQVTTGDQSAVPFAFGALDDSTIYINIGTGAFLQALTSAPVAPPLLTSVLYADTAGRQFVMEGTVNGAGAALRWLSNQRNEDIDRSVQELADADIARMNPPLFLNTVGGLGSPWWREGPPPRFTAAADAAGQVAAVLESIVFSINENLELMLRISSVLHRVIVTGGLSQSSYLVQALASISGMVVDCPQVAEATSRGAAALAFGPGFRFPDPPGQRTEPRALPALQARYQAWRAQMQASIE